MSSRVPSSSKSPRGGCLGILWLLPGVSHWRWGQRERALLIGLGFCSSLAMGVLTWGTSLGLMMLMLAFVLQVFSMTEGLNQAAFPGFGRLVPLIITSSGVGIGLYLPALLAASTFAWPATTVDGKSGYLVNRLAYRSQEPKRGDHVWLGGGKRPGHPQLGKMIAGAGQEIEWVVGRLAVDGKRLDFDPFGRGPCPDRMLFRVPEGQILVLYRGDARSTERWGLVGRDQIKGCAWAKAYPIWERTILN